jgi:cellulose synthase (UDP-forming)
LKNPVGNLSFIASYLALYKKFSGNHRAISKGVSLSLLLVFLACFSVIITIPLELNAQLALGLSSLVMALVLRKMSWGRLEVIVMIALSIAASLRYMYWRLTETVGFDTVLSSFFGWGLVFAELYTLCILLLGYVQTALPLERKVAILPDDVDQWPTVDIFIPTYNEPLSIVQTTVFAAQGLDWPASKFKIYLLDDGRRPEFKEFCDAAGVEYLSRENNLHYKAGNLNSALLKTSAEYVAIFDCDHIPTRSFLQITMGSFFQDPKLAMMQTPHFFYSPDPFERNLNTFRKIPNEGDLFYGLVQDGNDLWNASFFCGSCAVIRREPLLEVGGIAIETVTEDAHTALKLSRLGYNTGYLGIPVSAGLATESLSGHINQRIRWARGMAQIFRVDNPLLGPGLSLGQRLCYLNAMLHFFYGLPRLVFLTAPMAFLFFNAEVFHASALMVLVYALPHIFLSNITNSKIQKKFRHSFWNEVYETVLSWYLIAPVVRAVITPKSGVFNVTAKGSFVGEDFYDWKIARPYVILMMINVVGLLAGVILLIKGDVSTTTTLINLAWVLYNIVILGASIGVAYEKSHEWATPKVSAVIPASLIFPNGKSWACETHSFSTKSVGLTLARARDIAIGTEVKLALFRGPSEFIFPATVVSSGNTIEVVFEKLTLEQERQLTQMTFSRADNWATTWGRGPEDQLLKSLKGIFVYGLLNVVPLFFRATHVYTKKLPFRLIGQIKAIATKAPHLLHIPQFNFLRKK